MLKLLQKDSSHWGVTLEEETDAVITFLHHNKLQKKLEFSKETHTWGCIQKFPDLSWQWSKQQQQQ